MKWKRQDEHIGDVEIDTTDASESVSEEERSEEFGVKVGDGRGRGEVGDERQGECRGDSMKDGDLEADDLRLLLFGLSGVTNCSLNGGAGQD